MTSERSADEGSHFIGESRLETFRRLWRNDPSFRLWILLYAMIAVAAAAAVVGAMVL